MTYTLLEPWLPKSQFWWVPLAFSLVSGIIVQIVGNKLKLRVSLNLLHNANLDGLKESTKNILSTACITAVLMVTIVGAMLQIASLKPNFQIDDTGTMQDTLIIFEEFYRYLLILAFMLSLDSMVKSVVNLALMEPLSNTNAIKYCLTFPTVLGEPIISIRISAMLMVLALGCWVLGTYGMPSGIFTFLLAIVWISGERQWLWSRESFDAEQDSTWDWLLKEKSEWPDFMRGSDARTVALFQRMRRAIQEDTERDTLQSMLSKTVQSRYAAREPREVYSPLATREFTVV